MTPKLGLVGTRGWFKLSRQLGLVLPPAPWGWDSAEPGSALSQGQVGVTGAAGSAGARGWFVSQLISLLLFRLITDLAWQVGGYGCDWEHWAGLSQCGSFACALNRV